MINNRYIAIIFLCLINYGHSTLADNNSIYIGGKVGYRYLHKLSDSQNFTKTTDNSVKYSFGYGYEFDPAFSFGIAIGRHFKQINMRIEFDIHHTRAQIKNIIYKKSSSDPSAPDSNTSENITTKSTGDIRTTFVGGNIYYDFNNLKILDIIPYIGVGAGATMVDIKDDLTTGKDSDGDEINILYQDTKINEGKFALQGMLGAHYYFNKIISIFLEYRFSRVNSFKYNTDWSINSDDAKNFKKNNIAIKDFEDFFITHSISLGFKAIIA
ncbi:MAG: outer membrane beta-barrel protein [Legionellales bacterium]|nr:outer membrane beta-barrel protein [Legionellales bacterium]